jgi:hypothetical protein
MEKINTELFFNEYKKIGKKLDEISQIPKRFGNGDSFEGVEIESHGILYKSSSFYSGCGTDYYSFFITWDEINNPIEYFKDKYQKEFDDETKRINKLKEIAESAKRESEIKTLNKLMEKYKEEINFNNKESK